jgi:hypothetical protein
MQVVPIIAIDVRVPSAGVTRETDLIFENQLADKTVFIVESTGRSELLERKFPSRQARSLLVSCAADRVVEPIGVLIATYFDLGDLWNGHHHPRQRSHMRLNSSSGFWRNIWKCTKLL